MDIIKRCPCGEPWDSLWSSHNYFVHDCRFHGSQTCDWCKDARLLTTEVEKFLADQPNGG